LSRCRNDPPRALFSLYLSFLTSSSRHSRSEFHWPSSTLWRALCPACHTDAIIDMHTLPLSILVSPSRARAWICAKEPLHLVHRSCTQPFFSIRDFITYERPFLSHEQERSLVCITFWSFCLGVLVLRSNFREYFS